MMSISPIDYNSNDRAHIDGVGGPIYDFSKATFDFAKKEREKEGG